MRLADKIAPLMLVAVLAASAGCGGTTFEYSTPRGFVELEDQTRYDYRAVSADGVVLSVRELEHEPDGELEFWTRAVLNHMRLRGGYALLEELEVETDQGVAGAQLRFGHDEGSIPHLYYVTLFVTDDRIYVLEAGGAKDLMEEAAADIDRALRAFRIDAPG